MTDIPLYNQSSACAAGSCISCVSGDCFHPCHFFSQIQEGLVIRPGDTVIFTVGLNELETPEQVEDYHRRIREVMPDGVNVILTSTRPTVIRGEGTT